MLKDSPFPFFCVVLPVCNSIDVAFMCLLPFINRRNSGLWHLLYPPVLDLTPVSFDWKEMLLKALKKTKSGCAVSWFIQVGQFCLLCCHESRDRQKEEFLLFVFWIHYSAFPGQNQIQKAALSSFTLRIGTIGDQFTWRQRKRWHGIIEDWNGLCINTVARLPKGRGKWRAFVHWIANLLNKYRT